jgi:hypothetical protein
MKPMEMKPIEMKPMEMKPIEMKPMEMKPIEMKPMEMKPMEMKHKGMHQMNMPQMNMHHMMNKGKVAAEHAQKVLMKCHMSPDNEENMIRTVKINSSAKRMQKMMMDAKKNRRC